MSWVNAPMCERCWIDKNSEWEQLPELSAQGIEATALISIRQPVRLVDAPVEICHWCIRPTIFGVYVRTEVVNE
jgi:hypothetical protein